MTNCLCWGFLISRTYYIDYGPIVVPKFMYQANNYRLLAQVSEGNLTGEKQLLYHNVINSLVGNLTLIYRVVEATTKNTNIKAFVEEDGKQKKCVSNDDVLQDCFGRKISLIEGIVLKEVISDIKVTQDNFELIHDQLMNSYSQYWASDMDRPVISSEEFSLEVKEEKYFTYKKIKDYIVDSQSNLTLNENNKSEEIVIHKKVNSSQLWIHSKAFTIESEVISVVFTGKNNLIVRIGDSQQKVLQLNLENKADYKCLFWRNHLTFCRFHSPVIITSNDKYIASNDKYIASGMIDGDQNLIILYDLEQNKDKEINGHGNCANPNTLLNLLKSKNIPIDNIIRHLLFTPDNKKMISTDSQKIICSDIETEQPFFISQYNSCRGRINTIAIHPKGKLLAVGYMNGVINILEVSNSGSLTDKLTLNDNNSENRLPIRGLNFSLDGNFLFSAGDNYKIVVWNYREKSNYSILGEHSTAINCINLSFDGKLLASGDDNGCVKIWDIKNRKAIAVLADKNKHRKKVTSVAFSHNNQFLASGSEDKTVNLWQATNL